MLEWLIILILAVLLAYQWKLKNRKTKKITSLIKRMVLLIRQDSPECECPGPSEPAGLFRPRDIAMDYTFPIDSIDKLNSLKVEGMLKFEGKIALTPEDIEILKEIGIHIDDL